MRFASVLFLSLVLACGAAPAVADNPPTDEGKPSFWMEKKLEYSERILAGLTRADLEAIGKTARSMKSLTQMEKWVRAGVPEYRAQLHIFQDANEQLIRAADRGNLDAAALAYVQLTLSCVNCHKVVRGQEGKPAPPK
jgi:hypothetical protein